MKKMDSDIAVKLLADIASGKIKVADALKTATAHRNRTGKKRLNWVAVDGNIGKSLTDNTVYVKAKGITESLDISDTIPAMGKTAPKRFSLATPANTPAKPKA